MRLLNTETLRLEEYYGEIPPYAILSHRWEQEEVTYRDVDLGRERSLKGYTKVRSCCEKALSRGLQYAWVDTCCIDKSSSAELTESINSMYAWYERAQECYVFMADVDASHLDSIPGREEFRSSAWFTRGWTLQELIAPNRVLFYNNTWQLLGDKSDIDYLLERITGIEADLLCGRTKLTRYSIAQRLSWAASRTTTRPEDTAYCLLGIFNVNMPMLYGEGNNAFRRFQEEIIKASDDQTLFAWRDDRSIKPVLALSPSCFKGLGDLRCIYPTNDARFGHTLANSGLAIKLMLIPWTMNVYLAPLSCGQPKGVPQLHRGSIRGYDRLCIFLRQTEYENHLVRVAIDGQDSMMLDGDAVAKIRDDLGICDRQVFLRQFIDARSGGELLYGFEFLFKHPKMFMGGSKPGLVEVGGHGIWSEHHSVVQALAGNVFAVGSFWLSGLVDGFSPWIMYLGFDMDFAPACLITTTKSEPLLYSSVPLADKEEIFEPFGVGGPTLSWLLSEIARGESSKTALAFRGHMNAPAEISCGRLGLKISFAIGPSTNPDLSAWKVTFEQIPRVENIAAPVSSSPGPSRNFQASRPPTIIVSSQQTDGSSKQVESPDNGGLFGHSRTRTPSPSPPLGSTSSAGAAGNSKPGILKRLFRRSKSDQAGLEEYRRQLSRVDELGTNVVKIKTTRITRIPRWSTGDSL